MLKRVGLCVLVFFGLENFSAGSELTNNSGELNKETGVVEVFGLHFGHVYSAEKLREFSLDGKTICSAPFMRPNGSEVVYCSVTEPPDPFPFLKQYTLVLSLSRRLIAVEGSSTQSYGAEEGRYVIDDFEDCLGVASRLKEWVNEKYNITLASLVEEGTNGYPEDPKILKDGTRIVTWGWPKKAINHSQRRENLMEMTCSEELFNPGGYGILRLLSIGP